MMHTNKRKMDERNTKMDQDRSDMKKVIGERHVEEQDYREFERRVKDDDRDRRKIYKDTLDH